MTYRLALTVGLPGGLIYPDLILGTYYDLYPDLILGTYYDL